ncbi:hypothetical protein FGADI_9152 [Fusarium gaditjirri]|uniref:Uncharacterized protein n=1 Tax=Fusarium gaditjirri TaxID=282569 RepID=A0A8H4T0D3_9HYPO|nr:hypothetical protein FGADI_9152 [Fusarium gaditjirri]
MRFFLDIKRGLRQTTINIGNLLGSAFTMASAITASLPGLSIPLAGISGLARMIRTLTSTVQRQRRRRDRHSDFRGQSSCSRGKRKISDIVSPVDGDFRHAQIDLPKRMLVGGADNPPSGSLVMIQALLWQMAKLFKGFYVVIRDDLPISKCTHPHNAWDDRTGRCVDILSWWPKLASGRVGGDLVMEKVWNKLDMPPLDSS